MCNDKRRDFLKISGQTALLAATAPLLNLGYISAAQAQAANNHILVYVFLRGGWDGLSIVVPTNAARVKELNELRPKTGRISMDQKTLLKLKDGTKDFEFGLHPEMKGLHKLWKDGQVLFIHGAGAKSGNRSHFEQMALIESGVAGEGVNTPIGTGFLNRTLLGISPSSVIQGVAISALIPASLKGSKPTLASTNFQSYFRQSDASKRLRDIASTDVKGSRDALQSRIQDHLLGTAPQDPGSADKQLTGAGRNGIRSLDLVEDIVQESAGEYTGPAGGLFAQAERVIKAQKGKAGDQGVRTITIDIGGWDSHFDQRTMLEKSVGGLDAALSQFAKAVLPGGNVTIVVQSEFGRTARENGTGGTDHGRGTVMMVLAKKGELAKKVLTKNFSLAKSALDSGRDVAVNIDYREIFAEILTKRMGLPKKLITQQITVDGRTFEPIFPGYRGTEHNIFKGSA